MMLSLINCQIPPATLQIENLSHFSLLALISIKDDTMFLAGTSNLQDVWDDFKIPFRLTRFTNRYQDADNLLKSNPQVKKLVGHSLSVAVSMELQKQHPNRDYDITTYGAPLLQLGGQKYRRFRKSGDLISGLDDGAITYKGSINPKEAHSYTGY